MRRKSQGKSLTTGFARRDGKGKDRSGKSKAKHKLGLKGAYHKPPTTGFLCLVTGSAQRQRSTKHQGYQAELVRELLRKGGTCTALSRVPDLWAEVIALKSVGLRLMTAPTVVNGQQHKRLWLLDKVRGVVEVRHAS